MPTALEPAAIAGLILAGGRSARMGGRDKAGLALGGRPLLAQVAARLRPQVASLVVSSNSGETGGLPSIADPAPGGEGPLAGLLAGMAWARTFPAVVSLPCDTPFIPLDLVARLTAALGDHDLAVAASAGRRHHLVALWRTALAADLRHAFTHEGVRGVGRFAARHRVAVVEFPPAEPDPFMNLNTPEDLAQAQQWL